MSKESLNGFIWPALLARAYKEKLFCDFKIKTDAKTFDVHKLVLALRSPKFEAMIKHDTRESKESVLNLGPVKTKIMEKFLEFIYTGKLEISADTNAANTELREVLMLADEHVVDSLKTYCESHLISRFPGQFNIEIRDYSKIFDLMEFADRYNLKRFTEVLLEFICKNIGQAAEWPQSAISQWPVTGAKIILALAKQRKLQIDARLGIEAQRKSEFAFVINQNR